MGKNADMNDVVLKVEHLTKHYPIKKGVFGKSDACVHALEDASCAQNVQVLYACIAAPVSDGDPHLTRASIDFHTRRGYEIVGTFHRCGYKFDTWYDVVWMEKRLSDAAIPPAVVPFSSFVK